MFLLSSLIWQQSINWSFCKHALQAIQENDINSNDADENEDITSKKEPDVPIEEAPIHSEGVEEVPRTTEAVPADKKDLVINEEGNKKRRFSHKSNDSSTDRLHSRSHRHSRKDKDLNTMVDEFLNPKKPKNELEGNVPQVRSVSPGSRRSPRRQSPGGRRYRSRRERRRRSEERRSSRKRQRCRDYDGACMLFQVDILIRITSGSHVHWYLHVAY